MQLHDAQGKRLYLTADERVAFLAAAAKAARPVRLDQLVLGPPGDVPTALRCHSSVIEERNVRGPPPTGYLEIERALRLLALGDSDRWIAGKLDGVDHPAAVQAAILLRQGRRRQAQVLLEKSLVGWRESPTATDSPGSGTPGCKPRRPSISPPGVARWLSSRAIGFAVERRILPTFYARNPLIRYQCSGD